MSEKAEAIELYIKQAWQEWVDEHPLDFGGVVDDAVWKYLQDAFVSGCYAGKSYTAATADCEAKVRALREAIQDHMNRPDYWDGLRKAMEKR